MAFGRVSLLMRKNGVEKIKLKGTAVAVASLLRATARASTLPRWNTFLANTSRTCPFGVLSFQDLGR